MRDLAVVRFVCSLQLRQQAIALQKAATASEGVQDELRHQLELARQQCKNVQAQVDAQMKQSDAALAQLQQAHQDLQQQLAAATSKHAQEVQHHRYGSSESQCL